MNKSIEKHKINSSADHEEALDLTQIIIFLWINKWILLFSIMAGTSVFSLVAISFPEQDRWTASVYVSSPSMLTLYQEIKISAQTVENRDINLNSDRTSTEERLYVLMRNDLFNSALGTMISKGVLLKSAPPLTTAIDKIYIASVIGSTRSLSISKLKKIMDDSSLEAINSNILMSQKNKNIRAFNYVGNIHVSPMAKNKFKIYIACGIFFGALLGCCIVFIRHIIQESKNS